MNTPYVNGFVTKCAEHGIPRASALAILKQAQNVMGMQSTPMRATPGPFGKTTGTLPYQAPIKPLGPTQGGFAQVSSGTSTGWVPQVSFNMPKPKLSAGTTPVASKSTGEGLVLAGKG